MRVQTDKKNVNCLNLNSKPLNFCVENLSLDSGYISLWKMKISNIILKV